MITRIIAGSRIFVREDLLRKYASCSGSVLLPTLQSTQPGNARFTPSKPLRLNLRQRCTVRTHQRTLATVPEAARSNLPVPVQTEDAKKQLEVQKRVFVEAVSEDDGPWFEKFVPVTRQALVGKLEGEMGMFTPEERRNIGKFAAGLDAFVAQRFYAQLEEMKVLFDQLDPDKDTIQTKHVSSKELLDREYLIKQKLQFLLYKANYYKIPRSLMTKLLQEHGTWEGVKVSINAAKYETLEMWTRGRTAIRLSLFNHLKQRIMGIFFTMPHVGDMYTRVFVAVRSKGEKKLHLKVFKDVPCNKLEYLLPDGKIKMSNFDKSFLVTSILVGSLAIFTRSIGLLSHLKLDWGWIGLGVAGLIGARGWVGYKNKRNQYLVNLSRTIYFKMVSNNRGVLTLLTDRAQDEEFKEAFLAYLFLLSPANRRGVPGVAYTSAEPNFETPDSLKVRIEAWLKDRYGLDNISFDINDALEVLDSMGLLQRHSDGTLVVSDMAEALQILPKPAYHWNSFGALRNSESAEDATVSNEDALRHHKGWQ